MNVFGGPIENGVDVKLAVLVEDQPDFEETDTGYIQLILNQKTTFEMRAIRRMSNGLEIEFTKPLDPRCGWDPESYYVEQWPFASGSDKSGLESEPRAEASGAGSLAAGRASDRVLRAR